MTPYFKDMRALNLHLKWTILFEMVVNTRFNCPKCEACGRTAADLLKEQKDMSFNLLDPSPLRLYVCDGDPSHTCCLVCANAPNHTNQGQWTCACHANLDLNTVVDWIIDEVQQEVLQSLRDGGEWDE